MATESPWGATLANITDFIHLLLTVEVRGDIAPFLAHRFS